MRRAALVATLCAPVAVFLVLAWPALDENSGTYDEPFLVTAGYTYLTRGDFRLNVEHPPLVKELLALPLLGSSVRIGTDAEHAFAAALADADAQFVVGDRVFYHDNDPLPLLRRARLVTLALAALVVLLVGVWARDAFGALAGALAASLAACDPNLLAQGTQATTDLGFTLFFFAALLAVRQTFRALGPGITVVAGITIGACFAAKHSAVLLLPTILAFALVRLLDATPWRVTTGRRPITAARARVATLLVLAATWIVIVWGTLWACYGFRDAVGPGVSTPLPIAQRLARIRPEHVLAEMLARDEPVPDDDTLARAAAARPPLLAERVLGAVARSHLLPATYVFGLVEATVRGQIRNSYMLGTIALTGRTWYFPFALLVKTPLATLLLVVLALAAFVSGYRAIGATHPGVRRDALVLIVAAAIFLGSAMTSNLNIGFRHILPLVPMLCVLAGFAVAELQRRFAPRVAAVVACAACLLVAAETIAARPYFIPFFNAAAGGARGGLRLLSDSNLDVGQGLPALRRWMTTHRVERLNLSYFGSADPRAYGITFVPLLGTNFGDIEGAGTVGYAPQPPVLPGYVAVSATNLQGTYLPPELRAFYDFLKRKEPVAIPGGSTYVYWVERWGE